VSVDVFVIGGGPAGAAVALRLAQLGFRVRLAERRAFPRPHVGESLSPGVWTHFETLGVADAVARAGFRACTTTLLRWRGETERVVSERPSLVVDRGRFDALLLDAARDAGVDVRQPCDASSPDARFVIDASGRAAATRRPRREVAPRVIAWHARWPSADGREETLVERLDDAWLWGTALPDGTFSAMSFGKPLAALLRRSHLFAWLREPLDPPRAADATPYVCDDPIDMHSAAVGEAAFAIDPISSSGVQAAIASSIAAAIAVNTILRRPRDADAAIRFYTAHVARASTRHAAWAASSYEPPAPEVETVAGDIVLAPAVRGDFIELIPAVRTRSGDAVAYLGGTPLAPLVDSLRTPAPMPEILDRWSRTIPRPHAEAVLRWLVRERVVTAAADAPAAEAARRRIS